jgi:NADPH:quinone reductase-like Zn-dependent oxidoreductase
MKAVRIHEFGGPEQLRYEEVPDPELRKDQVLVRVRACALNHLDLWVRKGLPGVKLPHILGSDIAGEVAAVGEYVKDVKVGQRVIVAPMHFCGHCSKCLAGIQNQCREFSVLGNAVDGGNCELIAVPLASVIPIPDNLDFRTGGQRSAGVCDGVAHAGGTRESPPRTIRSGAGRRIGRGHRRHPNCQTLPGARCRNRRR